MRVRFVADAGLSPLAGRLVYRTQEYSFGFELAPGQELEHRVGSAGVTSVVLGMLQIEIGVETSIALFVWGYHPHTAWTTAALREMDPRPGGLRLELAEEQEGFEAGISITLTEINEWPTLFDPTSGWVCVGSQGDQGSTEYVAFASGTIAALRGEDLVALWLHPEMCE